MILYKKINKETSKEYGYRVLKDNIMHLNLKPGQGLSETELAKELNLSRTPVREILNRLKNEHLIEVKSQVGTYVSLIDKALIDEAIFMRYILEIEVLNELLGNTSKELLIELEKNIFNQKLIVDKEDCEIEFHKLDMEFHRLLFEDVDKRNVWNSVQYISTHYNRMRLLAEMNIDKNIVIKQHEKYLEILKSNNKQKINNIVDVAREHIKEPSEKWDIVMNNYEEICKYFK